MSDIVINKQDVEDLRKKLDVANKSNVARKVGDYYISSQITTEQRLLAEGIFRILIRDTEIKVRQVLADTLKNAQNLPSDIIDSILKDVDIVAVPFIQYSLALTDNDLINILNATSLPRQTAVAKRRNLSSTVSDAIAEKCSATVIEHLLTNKSSNIAPDSFEKIINKYPSNEILQKSIVYRNNLPFEVIEKIISRISYKLKTYLVLNHDLPQDFATDLINEIKEKLTLKISEDYSQDEQIHDFVKHLHHAGRLTHSLVTRSICSGDLLFFEHALSCLSDTPVFKVRKTLFNSSADFEIRNLLRKALLPKSVFATIFSALKVISSIRFDCDRFSAKLFCRKVIERILSYAPNTEELSHDDLNYLLSKIS